MFVMVFSTISLMVLLASMQLASATARYIKRTNRYFQAAAAAEAATEKVITEVTEDFHDQGEAQVYGQQDYYRQLVPSPAESPYWEDWEFNDAQGSVDRNYHYSDTFRVFQFLSSRRRRLRWDR